MPSVFWDQPAEQYQSQQGHILTGFHQLDLAAFIFLLLLSFLFLLLFHLLKAFGYNVDKEMFSYNSKGLSFSLKMWVGGYTLWFGSWLQVSKSPTSGKNIKWSLGFFFFILCGMKLWCKSLCLEHNLHNDLKCGGLGETHALFCQHEHPRYHNPEEKYQCLKEMFLTEVFQDVLLCADSGEEGNMLKTFAGLENNRFNNSRCF